LPRQLIRRECIGVSPEEGELWWLRVVDDSNRGDRDAMDIHRLRHRHGESGWRSRGCLAPSESAFGFLKL